MYWMCTNLCCFYKANCQKPGNTFSSEKDLAWVEISHNISPFVSNGKGSPLHIYLIILVLYINEGFHFFSLQWPMTHSTGSSYSTVLFSLTSSLCFRGREAFFGAWTVRQLGIFMLSCTLRASLSPRRYSQIICCLIYFACNLLMKPRACCTFNSLMHIFLSLQGAVAECLGHLIIVLQTQVWEWRLRVRFQVTIKLP